MRGPLVLVPDLEALADAVDDDRVRQVDLGAQVLRQGDAARRVVGQRLLLAEDRGFQRRTIGIAEGQAFDDGAVFGEQLVAARFQAVGFDGGEAEDAMLGAVFSRAEFLGDQETALAVQLLLVGREKHALPQSSPSARP